MIDFTLLSDDLGPEPVVTSSVATEPAHEPEPEHYHDEADAAHRREQGFDVVVDLPPIVDASDFVAIEYTRPPELVKGLVHKGTKVVIGGGSKSFKTWVQLDCALSIAYGLPWMGFETVPGRVLFANMEIQAQFFQDRLVKIAQTRGIQQIKDRLDVWNLRGFTASYRIVIPQIIQRIKDRDYAVVFLDPIYKLYGNTDENSASEVGQMLNELEKVCVTTGAAIAFGAHYSKGNQAAKEAIDRISGSGVFARDPDSIISFTRHEEEGSFVVEPILRNFPPQTPFVVTWNHPLMERNEDLDPSKLKQSGGRPKQTEPADLFDLLPEDGLTTSEWLEKAEKNLGISKRTFYRLKSDLAQGDVIILSKIDERWKPLKKR